MYLQSSRGKLLNMSGDGEGGGGGEGRGGGDETGYPCQWTHSRLFYWLSSPVKWDLLKANVNNRKYDIR